MCPLAAARTEEKCHLLIAEDTRWIIEKIYALAVRGVGAAKPQRY